MVNRFIEFLDLISIQNQPLLFNRRLNADENGQKDEDGENCQKNDEEQNDKQQSSGYQGGAGQEKISEDGEKLEDVRIDQNNHFNSQKSLQQYETVQR